MNIIKNISKYYIPKENESLKSHDTKLINLQIFLLIISKFILLLFVFINLFTHKPFAAYLNLCACIILIIISMYFKKSSHFYNTFMAYCLTLLTLVSTQHLISPKHQSSNILWLPLIFFVSTYLLDKKRNFFVMISGIILMSIAYIVPKGFEEFVFVVPLLPANIINIATILISSWTIYKIAGSFSYEEKKLRIDLEEGMNQISSLSETNMALLSILSHDLGTPLMTSKLLVKKIAKGDLSNCSKLEDKIDQMSIMLEDVRKLSALKCGKLEVATKPVYIAKVIESTIQDISALTQRKNITIKFKQEAWMESVQIICEENSFRRNVLMNILSNSIKFSHSNSIIKISMQKVNSKKLEISIEDNGIGMPEKIMNSIFDFNQITSRKGTHNEEGTGFGMPLVKLFVDAYLAEIKIKSREKSKENEQSGTTFILSLQLV